MFITIVRTKSCLEALLSLLLPNVLERHTLPQPQTKIMLQRREPMLTVFVEPFFSKSSSLSPDLFV